MTMAAYWRDAGRRNPQQLLCFVCETEREVNKRKRELNRRMDVRTKAEAVSHKTSLQKAEYLFVCCAHVCLDELLLAELILSRKCLPT